MAEYFLSSPWYSDIIYVLKNLQAPQEMDKTRARFLKQKVVKFCILNGSMYLNDPGGILLNCVVEKDAKRLVMDFHIRDCGDH